MTDLLDRLKSAVADRYTIQQELGRGGMATVYRAGKLTTDGRRQRPPASLKLGGSRLVISGPLRQHTRGRPS